MEIHFLFDSVGIEPCSAMILRSLNAQLTPFIHVDISSDPSTKRTNQIVSHLGVMYVKVIFTSYGLKSKEICFFSLNALYYFLKCTYNPLVLNCMSSILEDFTVITTTYPMKFHYVEFGEISQLHEQEKNSCTTHIRLSLFQLVFHS